MTLQCWVERVERATPLRQEQRIVAIKYKRKGERMHIFDTNFRMLNPQTCFEAVTADGTNTILLIPEREIDTDNLSSSVSEKRSGLQTNSEEDPSIPEPNTEGFQMAKGLLIKESPGAIQGESYCGSSGCVCIHCFLVQ